MLSSFFIHGVNCDHNFSPSRQKILSVRAFRSIEIWTFFLSIFQNRLNYGGPKLLFFLKTRLGLLWPERRETRNTFMHVVRSTRREKEALPSTWRGYPSDQLRDPSSHILNQGNFFVVKKFL